MDTPIFNAIREYINKNPIRFHMAGHSGNGFIEPFFNFAPYDITELDFSDNLENPQGIIKESQVFVSQVYNSLSSLYFTSGGTSAIYAALLAVKSYGNTIILPKNCHKSAFSAAEVLGLNTIIIEQATYDNFYNSVENYLKTDKSRANTIAAAVIVSPDYYGRINKELEKITNYLKNNNIISIIDEAHGSHFPFSSLLPESASRYADIVINNLFKTMPAQTGGVIMHIFKEELIDKAQRARKLIHTTSPSYITLASMEYAVAYFKLNGERDYKNIMGAIYNFNKAINGYGYKILKSEDFIRLIINTLGKSADAVRLLLQDNSIYIEGVIKDNLILIVTPFNYQFLDKLKNSLLNIDLSKIDDIDASIVSKAHNKKLVLAENSQANKNHIVNNQSKQADNSIELSKINNVDFNKITNIELIKINDSNDYLSTYELVNIDCSMGRVSAMEICLYPPATPFIFKGDTITTYHINYINANKSNIIGLFMDKIAVKK